MIYFLPDNGRYKREGGNNYMTFYQELQLNQSGSKNLIKNTSEKKERIYHIMVYLFKILLTMAFCMIFVIGYTQLFGEDNSITGVVVLLCVMVFRYADFGIQTREGIRILFLIFGLFRIMGFWECLTDILLSLFIY